MLYREVMPLCLYIHSEGRNVLDVIELMSRLSVSHLCKLLPKLGISTGQSLGKYNRRGENELAPTMWQIRANAYIFCM